MPNTLLSRGTHIFWVIGDGNKVMGDGNPKSKQPLSDFLASVCGTLWVLYSKTITWIKPTISYTLKEDNFFYKSCNSFSILISKNIIFYPLANMGIINIFISKDTFLLVNI